jgi:hypothetical protein
MPLMIIILGASFELELVKSMFNSCGSFGLQPMFLKSRSRYTSKPHVQLQVPTRTSAFIVIKLAIGSPILLSLKKNLISSASMKDDDLA